MVDQEKLAKLQKATRIGGKGTPRRKVKRTAKTEGDDKNLQATLKKLNAQRIPNIEQVNMLREDGKMLHFPRATVQGAYPSNTYAVSGNPVVREMSEFLPEVLSSMGPENMEQLRKITQQMQSQQGGEEGAKGGDDDEIPELVEGETFEDKVD